MQIQRAPRRSTKPPKRSPTPTRWLVAKDGNDANGRLEPLCVQAGAARVLPVFSYEEEAEMFVRLGGYDPGIWRARESHAGELISVLFGPCADARGVALDPLPEMLEDETVGLVWVGRRRFLRRFLGFPDGSTRHTQAAEGPAT